MDGKARIERFPLYRRLADSGRRQRSQTHVCNGLLRSVCGSSPPQAELTVSTGTRVRGAIDRLNPPRLAVIRPLALCTPRGGRVQVDQ